MSDARGEILDRLRRSLKRGAHDDARAAALTARLAEHRRNLVPARAQSLDHRGQIDLFVAMAEEVEATVARVAGAAAVPQAVVDFLTRHNLPARLVMTPDPQLADIPWPAQPMLEIRRGRAADADVTGVTACFAAIAETGTLMLLSGPASPTRNNFLPDNHIAVLRAGQVTASYEDGWDRLRAAAPLPDGGFALPRVVNFITGPSRTADIEQRLVLGAHGPRRLHIILVEEAQAGHGEPTAE
ncbi:MAG TPA: lactate utilization protein [Stellaceae bacterium]|nr:lactate utilization protein [Stellaceae bacterium]